MLLSSALFKLLQTQCHKAVELGPEPILETLGMRWEYTRIHT